MSVEIALCSGDLSVQINDLNQLGAPLLKVSCRGGRFAAIHGRTRHVALLEAVFGINRGDYGLHCSLLFAGLRRIILFEQVFDIGTAQHFDKADLLGLIKIDNQKSFRRI